MNSLQIRHWRAQLFHILHKPSPDNVRARYANYLLAFLIVANALSVALETVPGIGDVYRTEFKAFEVLSTALFAVEYFARLWTCVEQSGFRRPVVGRIRYALHPLPILDLLAIATFWMPIDLRFLRVTRIVRLLKVLNMPHLHNILEGIAAGLQRRRALILVAVSSMLLCVYSASALVYQLEHAAQPKVFTSIPVTFWWALETLTTIGYGDIVPMTPLGKFFTAMIAVMGIGVFALPAAIVTAVILEAGATDPIKRPCPHCGKD